MSELLSGERQVSGTLEGIRKDHRARYEWAASRLAGKRVVDAGCGVGYGSKILAEAGCTVRAFDRSEEAIAFAKEHYNHDPGIRYDVGELTSQMFPKNFDAVICFEALEHLAHPEKALRRFRDMAPTLYFSVPDEDGFPYRPEIAFHRRHYTRDQVGRLLEGNGWRLTEVLRQADAESAPEDLPVGRTIVGVAERVSEFALPPEPEPDEELQRHLINGVLPESVAIVAMGPSSRSYIQAALMAGGRRKLVGEVWGINMMAGLIETDRIFMMDDLKIQEARAAGGNNGVAGMLESLRAYEGRLYTSRSYPEWPNAEELPLEWIVNRNDNLGYYNSTVPYAFAFAAALGVKHIHLYGCDYSYTGKGMAHKREAGRACLENWMGWAVAKKIHITLPPDTSLMDASSPSLYGYDTEYVTMSFEDGRYAMSRVPRPTEAVPTAKQMEFRYSHDERLEALEGKV